MTRHSPPLVPVGIALLLVTSTVATGISGARLIEDGKSTDTAGISGVDPLRLRSSVSYDSEATPSTSDQRGPSMAECKATITDYGIKHKGTNEDITSNITAEPGETFVGWVKVTTQEACTEEHEDLAASVETAIYDDGELVSSSEVCQREIQDDSWSSDSPTVRCEGEFTVPSLNELPDDELVVSFWGTTYGFIDAHESLTISVQNVSAKITDYDPPTGTYVVGEDVEADVTVKNTGNVEHTFYVGYGVRDSNGNIYDNDNTTHESITLDPGEIDTVTVEWDSSESPPDTYDAITALWKRKEDGKLYGRLETRVAEDTFELEERNVNATITDFTPPTGEYTKGDTISADVTIKNTGNVEHTFYVGYGVIDSAGNVYDNDNTTHEPITLDPGETGTVTVEWDSSEAPADTYDVATAVWKREEDGRLHGRLDERRATDAFELTNRITAEITNLNLPSGTYTKGETVPTTVTVKNTGTVEHTFYVGYGVIDSNGEVYDNQNTTHESITLDPGETKSITVEWDSSQGHPDTYDVATAVWKREENNKLYGRLDSRRADDAFELKRAISATITGFQPPTGTYTYGETVTAQVTVENTGTQEHTFFVGYSVRAPDGNVYDNHNSTGTTVTLTPGERQTVSVTWSVQSAAPIGTYDAITAVWKESDPETLHTRLDRRSAEDTFELESAGATLQVRAKDRAGKNETTAIGILYDEEWTRIERKSSNANGVVIWRNLKGGTYHVEIYTNRGEFLGTRTLTVTGGTKKITFTPNSPYVTRRAGRSGNIDLIEFAPHDSSDDPRFYFHPDETVTLRGKVHNPSGQRRRVRVKFVVKNGSGRHITTVSKTVTLDSGASKDITLQYDIPPSATGDRIVDVSTRAEYTGDLQLTQTGDVVQLFTIYEEMLHVRQDNWGYEALKGDYLTQKGLNGTGIDIAVLVSGIDTKHPATNRVYRSGTAWERGKLNVVRTSSGDITDDPMAAGGYHGWAVTTSVWQFAPNASYYVIKVQDIGDIRQGIQEASRYNPDVIVLSQGTHRSYRDLARSYSNAVDADTTVVVAAGNSGEGRETTIPGKIREFLEPIPALFGPDYEGDYPASPSTGRKVMAIASTERDQSICLAGSPANSTTMPNKPDFAAPGCDVRTLGYPLSLAIGSSFAAPYTGGVVAQLTQHAYAHDQDAADVRRALRETAIPARTYNGSRDIDGDGSATDDDLDGYGRIMPVGAYHELLADDAVPTPNVTVTQVSATASSVSVRVTLENTGAASSGGGVHIALSNGGQLGTVEVGEFESSQRTTVDGVQVLELYTDKDEATSGTITFTVPNTNPRNIDVRGWLYDRHDVVYNPNRETYERYVARDPSEGMSADGDPLAEGEIVTSIPSNAPFNAHVQAPHFDILDYATESVTLRPQSAQDNEPPEPSLVANSNRIGMGESLILDASESIDPDGSNADLNYVWTLVEAPQGSNPDLPAGSKGELTLSKPGSYTFRVTVSDGVDTATATTTVTVDDGSDIAEATVRVESGSTMVDGTSTLDITISKVPDGLSGYELTVTIKNDNLAAISEVTFPDGFGLTEVHYGTDQTVVTLKAADITNAVTSGEKEVVLASITVNGTDVGKTSISVHVSHIDDENGNRLSVRTRAGTLRIRRLARIGDNEPPTDPDGDGHYEDVNGNARLDFDDVVVLFKHMNTQTVRDHVTAFDFNDNGRIDFDDLAELMEEI